MVQIKRETANMWESKAGNNATVAKTWKLQIETMKQLV